MKYSWKDLDFKKEDINENYTIFFTSDLNLDSFTDLIKFRNDCIVKIKSLGLEKKFISSYSDVFISNHEKFREVTNVPFDWAIGCDRETSLDPNNPVSHVLSIKKYINYFRGKDFSLQQKQGQQIHEYFHLIMSNILSKFIPALEEGLCEAVPRYIMNFEAFQKKHIAFIKSLSDAEIISAKDLNGKGISFFSKKMLGNNIGYASAFLFSLGILKRIENLNDVTKKEALNILLKALDSEKDMSKINVV